MRTVPRRGFQTKDLKVRMSFSLLQGRGEPPLAAGAATSAASLSGWEGADVLNNPHGAQETL